MIPLSIVTSVRDRLQESVEFCRTGDGAIELYIYSGVRIVAMMAHEPGAHRLEKRVSIGAAHLEDIADATVEVVLIASPAPERKVARWQQVVDQLCYRAVQALHELPEILTGSEVAKSVIVVIEEGRDAGDETEFICVMIEAVPKDQFRSFGIESGEFVSTARGDEVDRVIAIPVLEAMTTFEELVFCVGAFSKARVSSHGEPRVNAPGV